MSEFAIGVMKAEQRLNNSSLDSKDRTGALVNDGLFANSGFAASCARRMLVIVCCRFVAKLTVAAFTASLILIAVAAVVPWVALVLLVALLVALAVTLSFALLAALLAALVAALVAALAVALLAELFRFQTRRGAAERGLALNGFGLMSLGAALCVAAGTFSTATWPRMVTGVPAGASAAS